MTFRLKTLMKTVYIDTKFSDFFHQQPTSYKQVLTMMIKKPHIESYRIQCILIYMKSQRKEFVVTNLTKQLFVTLHVKNCVEMSV